MEILKIFLWLIAILTTFYFIRKYVIPYISEKLLYRKISKIANRLKKKYKDHPDLVKSFSELEHLAKKCNNQTKL